jgi:DNA invertase Pin-like site-specific DNA recombinase
MKVGIYARVSTEAQEARGTIGSQLDALRSRRGRSTQCGVCRRTDWHGPTPTRS